MRRRDAITVPTWNAAFAACELSGPSSGHLLIGWMLQPAWRDRRGHSAWVGCAFVRVMRLLLISPTNGRGGAEEYFLELVRAERERGWQVDAAIPATAAELLGPDLEEHGARIVLMPWAVTSAGKRDAAVGIGLDFIRTVRLLRDRRPDCVHLSLPTPMRGLGIMIAAAVLRTRLVTTFQIVDGAEGMSRPWRIGYALARRAGQRWIAVSDDNRTRLAAASGRPITMIDRVYNGVAPMPAVTESDRERSRSSVLGALGLGDHTTVVLTVARLTPQKGHANVVPAIRTVLESEPRAIFLWAGDGDERARLERAVTDAGVADAVRFLGTRGDVPDLLAAADLFLFPTIDEGSPFAIMEAMASGIPVVTSRRGPMLELIEDGRTGRTFEVDDPDDIASRVIEALADPHASRAMAARARRVATTKFSSDSMVQSTLSILEDSAST